MLTEMVCLCILAGVVPAGVSLTKAQIYVYGQGRDGSGKSDESQPKLYTGEPPHKHIPVKRNVYSML